MVESLDRLSRANINKALELFLSIINAGIVVVTLVDRAEYRADSNAHTLRDFTPVTLNRQSMSISGSKSGS